MGKQLNKVQKRRRRKAYIKRRTTATKVKAKTKKTAKA